MPKFTYQPRGEGDPENVTVGGVSFEKGKAVDVADERVAKKLAANPWFKAHGEKREQTQAKEAAAANAGGGDSGPVTGTSSTDVNYAPGIGQKSDPPSVLSASGEIKPADEGTRETDHMLSEQRASPKKGK